MKPNQDSTSGISRRWKKMNERPPYWTDPERSDFEVTIESVVKQDEYYHIRIKEEVIRAAGGGQAGDRGRLIAGNQSVMILDTINDSRGVILITDGALPGGTKGILEIDMVWRSSMMKNHTAEHLFVSYLKKMNRTITIGNLWIDGRHCSIEIVGSGLDFETLFTVEQEIIRSIEQDLPVTSEFVKSENIDQSVRLREGLLEKHSWLRVVKVAEVDSSACSGIHVARTSKIGFFKIIDVKIEEGRSHIEFTTGMGAMNLVSNLYNAVLQRKYTYPFEMEQVGAVLDKAKATFDDKEKLVEKTTQLLSRGSSVEWVGKVHFMHEYLPGYDSNSLRMLANQLVLEQPTIAILFAPGRKSQVLFRVNKLDKEASEYASKPVRQLGGKGGGKGEVFIGGFVDVKDSLKLYENLVYLVRELIDK